MNNLVLLSLLQETSEQLPLEKSVIVVQKEKLEKKRSYQKYNFYGHDHHQAETENN